MSSYHKKHEQYLLFMLTAHQCLKTMIIITVLDRFIPVLDTIVSEVQTPIGYQTLKMKANGSYPAHNG